MTLDVGPLAKAELHCHIDGLLDPRMLDELRAEGCDLPIASEALRACYPVRSRDAWLRGYGAVVAPCLEPRAERLPRMLEHHVRRLRAQRVAYAEIFVSGLLFAHDDVGVVVELFRALRRRIDAIAEGELRVELVVCIGRAPPQRLARQFPRIVALHAAGLVCGVALAGDEAAHPVAPLRPWFERFRERGMGIEIHAGESAGAASVRDAIEHGFPDRLGHGLAVFDDPALGELVRERAIHVELCPTSNLRLGAIARIEDHPLGRAHDLGIAVSINTDDPGPFECSLTSELELARDVFGFDEARFASVYEATMRAAFAGR